VNVALLALQAGQPEEPKWTDVAGFFATSAGVAVTLIAVLVALFGPRWQTKRSRPNLRIEAQPPGVGVPYDLDSVVGLQLLLRNDVGRDTAREVEVFASVVSHDDPDCVEDVVVEYESLVFENPVGGNTTPTSATVPAGFARPVWFALIGTRKAASAGFVFDVDDREASDLGAAITIDPYARHGMPWLRTDRNYEAKLVVTGSNFDALTFAGTLRGAIRPEPIVDGGPLVDVVEFRWTNALKPIHDPNPATPWIVRPGTRQWLRWPLRLRR
jgi:hypothetical protein